MTHSYPNARPVHVVRIGSGRDGLGEMYAEINRQRAALPYRPTVYETTRAEEMAREVERILHDGA